MKERVENASKNFPKGYLEQEEEPKTLNDDLLIPNLVLILILIIIRGGINHFHIYPTPPRDSMHIWKYILKHVGWFSCTLGLEKFKVLKTNLSRLT